MKRTMTVVSLAVVSAAWLSAQQPAPPQPGPPQPAGPPRGSSGPPEHAKVTPINNLPNPYETIRNWGTLPDGRKWGSVSAVHVDVDGKHIWAGDRCGTNCVRRVRTSIRWSSSIRTARSWRASAPDRSSGRTAWTSTSRATSGSPTRGRRRRRSSKKFPDAEGKGHTVHEVQPAGQGAADARHAGRGGRSAGEVHRAERRARRARRQHLRRRGAQRAVPRSESAAPAIGRISKFAPDGKFIKSFGSYGYGPSQFRGPHSLAMDSRAACSSPIAATAASRSSIRTASTSTPGTSSAASAASTSIATTRSTRSTRSRTTTTTRAGARACASAARAPARCGTSCPSTSRSMPSGMGGYGSMGEGVAVDARRQRLRRRSRADPGPDQVRAAPQALSHRHDRPITVTDHEYHGNFRKP